MREVFNQVTRIPYSVGSQRGLHLTPFRCIKSSDQECGHQGVCDNPKQDSKLTVNLFQLPSDPLHHNGSDHVTTSSLSRSSIDSVEVTLTWDGASGELIDAIGSKTSDERLYPIDQRL